MSHLTHNGHQLSTKNKLEKAVAAYLKSIDRTLIQNQDLSQYKAQILDDISKINKDHARCKPLNPHWFETAKNDFILSGVHFSNFMIYHVKRDYHGWDAS